MGTSCSRAGPAPVRARTTGVVLAQHTSVMQLTLPLYQQCGRHLYPLTPLSTGTPYIREIPPGLVFANSCLSLTCCYMRVHALAM